jgi:hypothetical protein
MNRQRVPVVRDVPSDRAHAMRHARALRPARAASPEIEDDMEQGRSKRAQHVPSAAAEQLQSKRRRKVHDAQSTRQRVSIDPDRDREGEEGRQRGLRRVTHNASSPDASPVLAALHAEESDSGRHHAVSDQAAGPEHQEQHQRRKLHRGMDSSEPSQARGSSPGHPGPCSDESSQESDQSVSNAEPRRSPKHKAGRSLGLHLTHPSSDPASQNRSPSSRYDSMRSSEHALGNESDPEADSLAPPDMPPSPGTVPRVFYESSDSESVVDDDGFFMCDIHDRPRRCERSAHRLEAFALDTARLPPDTSHKTRFPRESALRASRERMERTASPLILDSSSDDDLEEDVGFWASEPLMRDRASRSDGHTTRKMTARHREVRADKAALRISHHTGESSGRRAVATASSSSKQRRRQGTTVASRTRENDNHGLKWGSGGGGLSWAAQGILTERRPHPQHKRLSRRPPTM